MAAPPQTLIDAGVNPPAEPEVMRMPALGDESWTVSWHGMVGHWSPLDRIVPNVVPPSGTSVKSLEKTVGWVSTLSNMPSPSLSWVVTDVTVRMKAADGAVAPLWS